MTRNMMGAQLFSSDLTHSRITELVKNGMEFKTTKLSEAFSYGDFVRKYEQAYLLAILDERGDLNIVTGDVTPEPISRQTLIALVGPEKN